MSEPRLPVPTDYPSPPRASLLESQHERLASDPAVPRLLEAFPGPAMILNERREIVLGNAALAASLGLAPESLVGMRPGDAMRCVHAAGGKSACGADPACQQCGALHAVLQAGRSGDGDPIELHLTRCDEHGELSADFRVHSTVLLVNDTRFTLLALEDTGDEKRRHVLERLFFHDLLNLAGGLRSLLASVPGGADSEAADAVALARSVTEQLIEEIQAQRDLLVAERGDLETLVSDVHVPSMLSEIVDTFRRDPLSEGKSLPPPEISGPALICTDPVLLRRVLRNVIKNAIEASRPGNTVRVSYRGAGEAVFSVHNEGAMHPWVRAQVFHRSFSTKASRGRGLGTYSVKLLVERYLGGKVEVESSPRDGTTFRIRISSGSGRA